MAFMVTAYLIIWFASFALIFSMVYRQRTIDQEIATLSEALRDHRETGR